MASGVQLFVGGALMVWLPSYLNRYYNLTADKAGALSGLMVLCSGVGMIVCGMLTDKLALKNPQTKVSLAITYCLFSAILLSLGFAAPAGTLQLILIAAGMFVVAGITGPAGAIVANLTPVAIHGTAFATLAFANNLLGLAPAPFVVGALADLYGLNKAMQMIPVMALIAAFLFWRAKQSYTADLSRCQHLPQ